MHDSTSPGHSSDRPPDVSAIADAIVRQMALAGGVALVALVAFAIVTASSGGFSPKFIHHLRWSGGELQRDRSDITGGGASLGYLWGGSLAIAFGAGVRCAYLARARARLGRLALAPPVFAQLTVVETDGGKFRATLVGPVQALGHSRREVYAGGSIEPPWFRRTQEVEVRVRSLGGDGPFLLQAPSGELALVTPA